MRYEIEKYVYSLRRKIKDFEESASANDCAEWERVYIKTIRTIADDLEKILEGPR